MDFRDRRPSGHLPTSEDYETPLTRTSITEANRRFRSSGMPQTVGNDSSGAANLIRETTKNRFKNRRSNGEDFGTVGEYLEFLNGIEGDVQ